MENNKKIILFDGVCNLCNSAVKFIIKRDHNDLFRFAALQSESGAALEIGKNLKGQRTISSILLWLPESFRNIVYDIVAKNRYKWYGKRDSCIIPSEELKNKFI